MPSWGNNDNAASAPKWAVNPSIVKSTAAAAVSMPTAANVAVLYANTTSGSYITGKTIGLFAIDAAESANSQQSKAVAHTGWVLRKTGSGGRAGRTTYETLVTLSTIIGDGDATTIANTANP
jgi:hypothetical protein